MSDHVLLSWFRLTFAELSIAVTLCNVRISLNTNLPPCHMLQRNSPRRFASRLPVVWPASVLSSPTSQPRSGSSTCFRLVCFHCVLLSTLMHHPGTGYVTLCFFNHCHGLNHVTIAIMWPQYSQTCVMQPHKGCTKSGCLRQVAA